MKGVSHAIVTTVGNIAFPAGPVLLGSNGVALASTAPAGTFVTYGNFCNANYAGSGFPAGTAALMPFWNDLMAINANTTLYWQESAGVLYIMWKGIGHYFAVAGQDMTFEIQVPRVIRVLMHYHAPDNHVARHVYLGEARTLRQDLEGAQ